MAPSAGRAAVLPALALVLNAFTWGVSWWPLRALEGVGLHPLWATALIYTIAVALISVRHPGAWGELRRTPALWLLMAAAGTNNASFNWAVTVGDVVRVILLFYVMPVWAVLLARVLLRERLTPAALLRVALALAGAATVLWPADGAGWPLPRTLAEGLGLLGGFAFALNNVLLRREAARSPSSRALAMFLGGVLVSVVLALAAGAPAPPTPAPGWIGGLLALALAYLGGNLALQHGAARLPAHATAVIMLTEVLFASVSAVLLGAGTVTPTLLLGGGLILLASLLAVHH